jgi:AhpD family alkylhydroperoxidase
MRVRRVCPEQAALPIQSYFSNGQPGDLVASLAHVPEVLTVAMPFIGQMLGPSSLSERVKEIVVLGVSALQGCQYCTDTHTVVAHQSGLSQSEILVLRQASKDDVFVDPAEAALWHLVQTLGGGRVDSAQIEHAMTQMTQHWLEFEMVEITMLISTTIMLNRYCIAMNIPVSEVHQVWLNEQPWLDL